MESSGIIHTHTHTHTLFKITIFTFDEQTIRMQFKNNKIEGNKTKHMECSTVAHMQWDQQQQNTFYRREATKKKQRRRRKQTDPAYVM